MEHKDHTQKTWRGRALTAAFVVSLSALASGVAHAQQPADQPNPPAQPAPQNPTPATDPLLPASQNPGTSQAEGTPSGAAAQGESATQGSVPAAPGILPPLNAQPLNVPPPGKSRVQVTSTTAVSSIVRRAQDMLRVANARQLDAPSGARASYRKAAQSLRQMLVTAGYSSAASSALGADPANGVRAASPSSLPVSSEQIGDDIRVLRQAARLRNASPDAMKMASLYATGAKEFFTGQLRDALFDSSTQVAMRTSARVETPAEPSNRNDQAAEERFARTGVPFPVTLQRPQQQTVLVPVPQQTSSASSAALPEEPGYAVQSVTPNINIVPTYPFTSALIQGFNSAASATAGGTGFPVSPTFGGFGGFVQPIAPFSFGGAGYFGGTGYFGGPGYAQ